MRTAGTRAETPLGTAAALVLSFIALNLAAGVAQLISR
jgi:hypothetical protein